MKFRTEINIPKLPFSIVLDTKMMFLGSCFSEHVSGFFAARKFPVCANPFGILFNPLSIAQTLDFMTGKSSLSDRFYQYFDEKWISFAHHGKFSHADKSVFLNQISDALQNGSSFLQNTDILFLTFGTSYYYYHLEKELVVANCHRVPGACFDKKRAEIDQICAAFAPFFAWRAQHNPNLKVVFTVSPVRHLSDGFHENQLSKSILHLSIEKMLDSYPETCYFPSYEIFQDDLRDYRFYDKDLCHPSVEGVEYVMDKLLQSTMSPAMLQKITELEKVVRREAHLKVRS